MRYEYKTAQFPRPATGPQHCWWASTEPDGWEQVWADVTEHGAFVVFRREDKTEPIPFG